MASESIIMPSLMFLDNFGKIMKKFCWAPSYTHFPLNGQKSPILPNFETKYLSRLYESNFPLPMAQVPRLGRKIPEFWGPNSQISVSISIPTDPRKSRFLVIFGLNSAKNDSKFRQIGLNFIQDT